MTGSADTKVFISYSRVDREFALRLSDALQQRGVQVFRDLDDILPTEEWWPRIEALIGASDTVVFVISPESVASPVCAREIALCERLGKRLAPLIWRPAETDAVPESLSKLNYVFATEIDDFERAVDTLVAALDTDIGWVREHTRIGELARRWQGRGRRGSLLSGDELKDAEAWLFTQPHSTSAPVPTEVERAFVQASRAAAVRRQRWTIGLSLAAAVVASALAGVALWQRGVAVQNEAAANENAHRADANAETAKANERTAKENERLAQQALGRVFAERAWQARGRKEPLLAARYALAGSRLSPVETGNRAVLASLLYDANESKIVEKRDVPLRMAAPSRTGAHVVTIGREAPIHVVDANNGRRVSAFDDHDLIAYGAAFSPDMKTILSWSADSTARLWNAETGKEIGPPMEHPAPVVHALLSPNGRFVVTVSHMDRFNAETWTIHIWPAHGGQSRNIPVQYVVLAAAVSPDSQRLYVVTSGRNVEVFDLNAGTRVTSGRPFRGAPGEGAAAITPAGTGVVLANEDGTASVFSIDGTERATLRGHDGPIRRIAVSDDLTVIATVGVDGTVRVWDGAKGDQVAILTGHVGAVNSVSFIPSDGALLTAGDDGTARIWRPGRRVAAFERPRVSDVAFSPDGRRLALASAEAITVEPIGQGSPLSFKWPISGGEGREIRAVAFANTGASPGTVNSVVAADSYGAVVAFDLASGKSTVMERKQKQEQSWAVALSPDGSRLAVTTLGAPTTVTVTEARTGALIAELKGHVGTVRALSFSRDGRRLAVGTPDGHARLWQVDDGRSLFECGVMPRQFETQATYFSPTKQTLRAIATSAPGDRMAIALSAGDVRVCNGEPKDDIILRGHTSLISSIAFDSNTEFIVSGGADAARVWDIQAGRQIAQFGTLVGEVAFSPDRTRLVTAATRYTDTRPLQGRVVESFVTSVWDVTLLSRSIDDLTAAACVLLTGVTRFSDVEIAQDRLIRDAWLIKRGDGDLCRR